MFKLVFIRFHKGPFIKGVLSICLTGSALLKKMVAMPLYGKKTLKNLFLQNQESFEAESLYIALGTQGLPSFSNDDPRITVDLFLARSYFYPSCCGSTKRKLHGICRYAMVFYSGQ